MFKDFFLNVIGSAILTIATQLLAYPFLGRVLSAEEYGTMLTAMAIANTVGISIGNSLNNTRLLVQSDYSKQYFTGDFNRIILALIIPCFTASLTAALITCNLFWSYGFGMALVSVLTLMRSYYLVAFRLIIDYKRVVVANCIGFAGYLVGIGFAWLTGWWPILFIAGEIAILIYLFNTTGLPSEGWNQTPLFSTTVRRFGVLLLATALGQAMSYMDRFLIYPVLGAEQVSIFTVASLLGKTVGIIAGPVSGVLLTYYAKEDAKITMREFVRRVLTSTALCAISYVIVMALAGPVLGFLYPDYVSRISLYLPISNAGAIVLILGNILSPTLLKSADNRWQPIIQVMHLVTYIVLSIYLSKNLGLFGFCLGVLLANSIRFVLMVFVMLVTLRIHNDK